MKSVLLRVLGVVIIAVALCGGAPVILVAAKEAMKKGSTPEEQGRAFGALAAEVFVIFCGVKVFRMGAFKPPSSNDAIRP